jgi:hypothetical protein
MLAANQPHRYITNPMRMKQSCENIWACCCRSGGPQRGWPRLYPPRQVGIRCLIKSFLQASNQLCIVTCAAQRVGTLHPIASRPGRLEGRLAVPRTRSGRHRLLTKPFSHPSDQQDTPAHATLSMQDAHGDVGLLTAAARFVPTPPKSNACTPAAKGRSVSSARSSLSRRDGSTTKQPHSLRCAASTQVPRRSAMPHTALRMPSCAHARSLAR